MDKRELIEEVVKEVKKKIGEPAMSKEFLPAALVVGTLKSEAKSILKSRFFLHPLIEEEGQNLENRYAAVILAELSLSLLGELAVGIPCSREANFVLEALLMGKDVFLMEDGICYRKYKESAYKTLYSQYQEYEDRIRKFGIQLLGHPGEIPSKRGSLAVCRTDGQMMDMTGLRLLRESDLLREPARGAGTILLNKDALITPLAKDYIANHSLCVKRTAKR